MELTLEQFAAAAGASSANAAQYFDAATAAMERFGITEPACIAAFCAHVSVETARLTKMEEDLYYKDAKRLAGLFLRVFDEDHNRVITDDEVVKAMPYIKNPKGLSMRLYGGFHGRGGAQLTWERNYRAHGDKLGVNYVSNPGLLLTPEHAMLSAASFYDSINGNDVAHDMGEMTARWNGPKRMHLAERIAQYNTALSALV